MTPAQKAAIRPYRKQLKQAFAEAAPTAATPGKARTWFVPYLAAVLKIYRKFTTQTVDGRPLSKALAKRSRDAFFKLLKSSNRDPKTRSRWAAVLTNAHQSGVSPEEFPIWLKKGGGAAGRASELSKATRALKQTASQPNDGIAKPSPQPNASPEANDVSPLATNNSNVHH